MAACALLISVVLVPICHGVRTGGSRFRRKISLSQEDFDYGTYRITSPGRYVLTEDISFHPNPPDGGLRDPYHSFMPTVEQLEDPDSRYPAPLYSIGFFAAITVETSHVEIDLNGFTLEQSVGHALMQRFFTLIELANAPFIPGQGPHRFTDEFAPASNVLIHSGTLGRSAHHGIHGNDNAHITVRNVDFRGYEVAAVGMNGVQYFTMENCYLKTRTDVPVRGSFSTIRVLSGFVDHLVDTNSDTQLHVTDRYLTARDIKNKIRLAINNVYADVTRDGGVEVRLHPEEYALFANPSQLPDGNCYGVLLNKLGVAINGFPNRPGRGEQPSRHVVLRNVHIDGQRCVVRETVALRNHDGPTVDVGGALLQVFDRNPSGVYESIKIPDNGTLHDAYYVGDLVTNAQLFVALAVRNGDFYGSTLDVSRGTAIGDDLLNWVQSRTQGGLYVALGSTPYMCNADSMFHVQKGTIGFKIDASEYVELSNCSVKRLENYGEQGSTVCGDYAFSHPMATLPGYTGTPSRGFSFAGSRRVSVEHISAEHVVSHHGNATGVDIFTNSREIHLRNVRIDDVCSHVPGGRSSGIHVGELTVHVLVWDHQISNVSAPQGIASAVYNEGRRSRVCRLVQNNICVS